jgi:predicted MFS family arabinose efflux permease
VRTPNYSEILRTPHVARLLATSLVARLPQGMSSLAILLLLAPRDGYGRAGIGTGASVLTGCVSSVLLARAVDRRGARQVLVPTAAWYAAAMIGLSLDAGGRYPGQLGICALVGIATPPVTAVARSMWAQLLGPDQAQRVFGLEATAQELIYVTGPALVALIAGTVGPRSAVITTGGIGLVGAVAFVSAEPFASFEPRERPRRHRVLRGTGLLGYAATGVCLTICFAMTEIATVAFVGGKQASAVSGVVLAAWSAGSLVGGLWFGSPAGAVTDRGLAATITTMGGILALTSLSPDPVVLAVILAGSGLAIAPSLARLYTRIGRIAPEGSTTEAFGWLGTAFLLGTAVGSSLGGITVDGLGARPALALSGLLALGGAGLVGLKARRRQPAVDR